MEREKILYLVRHGKSSWGYENITDIDRPLKNRGIRNAYEMASKLVEKGTQPDFIISSPANRALHTATIFASEMSRCYQAIKVEEIIYFSDEHTIYDFIKRTSDAVTTLMIFGHNPIISNLANIFLKNQVDYIPTAGVVELKFNVSSWMKIERDNCFSEWYQTPKK